MRPELLKVKVMGHGPSAVGRQGFSLMGQLFSVDRTLEPLMTDRTCNWPGGNNMPGACQVRRVLPA